MSRDTGTIRYVPLDGLTVDILEKLAQILAGKPEVPEGVVYHVGRIAPLWDADRFEVE